MVIAIAGVGGVPPMKGCPSYLVIQAMNEMTLSDYGFNGHGGASGQGRVACSSLYLLHSLVSSSLSMECRIETIGIRIGRTSQHTRGRDLKAVDAGLI